MVYFAMTQSLLQYGITAWGGEGLRVVTYNKLLTEQNSIIKIIFKKPNTFPSDYLSKDLKVLNIQQLFYRNSLFYTFKLGLIDIGRKMYNTRKENNLLIQTFKTQKPNKHFVKVGLDLLQNAPHNIIK